MITLFGKQRGSHGPQLLNSAGWNPDLHPRNSIGEFIYTDGGLHGGPAKKAPQAIPYRAGYRRIGKNVVKTDEIPTNSQKFTAPNGKTFLAPAGTNFQDVYNAGKMEAAAQSPAISIILSILPTLMPPIMRSVSI